MAMSVGGGEEGGPMMDINTTPLIDVMLVLLIMFIITIPIQTHAVKLDMPQQNNQSNPPPTDPVINRVSINFDGTLLWNGTQVDEATLEQYFQQAAVQNPQPETHLRPDKFAHYEKVAKVMASAQRSGIQKMGFVGNEAYMQ
jgi:biopolymer transport protein ExbD